MSWLVYGLDKDNVLIPIEETPKGKTSLKCPYCGGELTAKKGNIKDHHFAHTGETCRAVARRRDADIPTLPLYDHFNIHLGGKELAQLKWLWYNYGVDNRPIFDVSLSLKRAGLLEWKERRPTRTGFGCYEFTKLGKIPVGALSLMLFNEVQEPLIREKLEQLEEDAEEAFIFNKTDLPERLTDLKLYRAQLRRILLQSLYYLEIIGNGKTFYKIGVTTRPIEERITEIKQDLSLHFRAINIKIQGVWEHRGNVEKYFKHRYEDFNYPIGTLSEYYFFDDPKDGKAVLRDLRRMKPKILSEKELEILSGNKSQIELEIEATERSLKRSAAIKRGMESARKWNEPIGRPKGNESTEKFLQKPKNQAVIEALNEGLSLRVTAKRAGVSVNTVRKVQAIISQLSEN